MANVTAVFAELHVLPLSINMQSAENSILLYITLGCRNTVHLQQIMSRIRSVKDVEGVERVMT